MQKNYYSILALVGILFLLGSFWYYDSHSIEVVIQSPSVAEKPVGPVNSVKISVPFTSQAPYANWDDPYQEACEEAAFLMVHHYLLQTSFTTEQIDKEIVDMTTWVAENSLPQDMTIEQLAWVAKNYYGHEYRIIKDPLLEDLEYEIANGNPVIVPAAGRQLGNPHFSGEGPWYHMLVLLGYTEKEFITNDPGTKHGKNYRYEKQLLYSAIHDWTGVKEEIESGPKVALVLY